MVDSATSYDLGVPGQPPQPVPYESDMEDEDDSDGEEAAMSDDSYQPSDQSSDDEMEDSFS